MKKPKYTTVRLARADYELLQKAKTMMEKDPRLTIWRNLKLPLGWTIGTLAEFYLLAKKRKIV